MKLLAPTQCVNYWGVGFNYPSHLHQASETSGQEIPKLPRPWQKGVGSLIGYMSTFTTLYPGDLILTGASGTTQAMKPGDVVEVEISGIGVLRNPVQLEKSVRK